MSDYSIKLTVRNARILNVIKNMGYKSQSEFARAANISIQNLNALVAFRELPTNKNGTFKITASKLLEFTGRAPEDLWTSEQLFLNVKRNTYEIEFNEGQLQRLMADSKTQILSLEDKVAAEEEKKWLMDKIDMSLTSRQALVIKQRFFNEKTLEEMAQMLGVNRERVRQIELQALNKLREKYNGDYFSDIALEED